MMSVFFHLQHTLNIFFNNCKYRGGGGGGGWVWGQFENNFRKKLRSKSPAKLGLNLMGFTGLFYREISFRFFKEDFFTKPVTLK